MSEKIKRFAVVEKVKEYPEIVAGRFSWYGEFETREEAEKYIADSKLQNVGILDLEDAVDEIKEGK